MLSAEIAAYWYPIYLLNQVAFSCFLLRSQNTGIRFTGASWTQLLPSLPSSVLFADFFITFFLPLLVHIINNVAAIQACIFRNPHMKVTVSIQPQQACRTLGIQDCCIMPCTFGFLRPGPGPSRSSQQMQKRESQRLENQRRKGQRLENSRREGNINYHLCNFPQKGLDWVHLEAASKCK